MKTSAIEIFKSTVQYENDYIWLKPVCDFFKINYENQTRKIKSDKILANHSIKKSSSLMFGDNYPRILVDKIGFIRWIQLINANTIDENLQDKFSNYQEMVFDYLFGNIDQEKKANHNYARLNKLKRLNKKIGMEIKVCQDEINLYLAGKFIQHKIDFNNSRQQKSIEG
jgi:hypothetical protein